MSKKYIIGLITSVLLSATANSATVYVSDIQFVAIREGLSNNTRAIERGIKSGTPLEVINQDSGYTKVRTPNGNEGWVADYFLSENTVTRDQLNALQAIINKAIKDKTDLSEDLKNSQTQIQQLNELNLSLKNENDTLKQQIESNTELSEEAQGIVTQSEGLSYQIASLKQQAHTAIMKAEALQNTTEQKWFMIGVATLLGGLLLGVLVPITGRRKNSSGSWS